MKSLKLNTLTTLHTSPLRTATSTCIAHHEVVSIHVERCTIRSNSLCITVQSDNVSESGVQRVNNKFGSITVPMWLVKERGVLACTQLNNVQLKELCGFGVRMCTVVRDLAKCAL